jgi:hypothetical protein
MGYYAPKPPSQQRFLHIPKPSHKN